MIALDAKKSLNSKLYPTLSPYSTLIPHEPKKLKMQLLSTMPKLLTKSKPLLLQRLSEEDTPKLGYNPIEIDSMSTVDPKVLTKQSMILYPKSVVNLTCQSEANPQVIPTMEMTSTSLQIKDAEFLNPKCPGMFKKKKPDETEISSLRNLGESSNSLRVTIKSSNSGSKPLKLLHLDSQVQNGTTLSKVKPSNSTPCSHHCTIYPLLKRTLDAWHQLNFLWTIRTSKEASNERRMDQHLERHHQSDQICFPSP